MRYNQNMDLYNGWPNKCAVCEKGVSGLGHCDACSVTLCFLCHKQKIQPNGTAVLCPKCHKVKASVRVPRWQNYPLKEETRNAPAVARSNLRHRGNQEEMVASAIPTTSAKEPPSSAIPTTSAKGPPSGAIPMTSARGKVSGAIPMTSAKGSPTDLCQGTPSGAVTEQLSGITSTLS